jgi:hypothetical protein
MAWQNAPSLRKLTAAQHSGDRGAQLWGVDIKGNLHTTYQKSPGGVWSNWMGQEWAPTHHPKQVYELAACQLGDGRVHLWVLDYRHEIWNVYQEEPGGVWGHWWHPRPPRRWNNAPAPFKKMAATRMAKFANSLRDVNGTMFIGLKDDGRLAVCYGNPDSWSRFRNDWHGASQLIEVTACQQGGDGRVAVWALDEQRQLWGAFEKAAGTADFDPWAGPNWRGAPRLRNIAAVEGHNGAIIFGQDEQYRMVANFQTSPGGEWSGWTQPGWANAPPSFELTAAGQNNGRAQLWAVTNRGTLTSIAQGDAGRWPDAWSHKDDDSSLPTPPPKPSR